MLVRLGGSSIRRGSAGHLVIGLALLAGRLLGTEDLVQTSSLVRAAAGFLLLQLSQALGLVVDVLHLLGAGGVEVDNLLGARRLQGLLKVRGEAAEQAVSPRSDAVALVGRLGAVGCVVLLVEVLDCRQEALRDAVLLVESNGRLQAAVGNEVAAGQVLGKDARAGLLLLCDLICVAVGVGLGVDIVSGIGVLSRSRGDGELVLAKLGVIEEKSSASGALLFKGHRGGLGLAFGGDIEGADLAAVPGSSLACIPVIHLFGTQEAYQKLKKARMSFSSVLAPMFLT